MTIAQLWPLLVVSGLGLVLVLTAVFIHVKTDSESDAGCLAIILGIIGVVLLWKSTGAITDLMGHKG